MSSNRIRNFGRQLRTVASVMNGAVACAAAAEAGRRPNRAALKAVGIDADTFYEIQGR